MPCPNLPFNGLHLRNPCKLHGSLLIYRPWRDGRLSWPSWLTHSGRLIHEVVTHQPWIRRRSGKVCQLQTDVLTTEPLRQPLLQVIQSSLAFNAGTSWTAVVRSHPIDCKLRPSTAQHRRINTLLPLRRRVGHLSGKNTCVVTIVSK